MTKVIHQTKEKRKEEIWKAVATAKLSVIKDLNTEYKAIVKELSVYDTEKEGLEKNMSDAIIILEIAKASCLETRKRNQHCHIIDSDFKR